MLSDNAVFLALSEISLFGPLPAQRGATIRAMSASPRNIRLMLLLLVLSATAYAACVSGHPSVSKEFRASKAVVVAKIVARSYVPPTKDGFFLEGTMYRITVERIYRGEMQRGAGIFSENSSGRFPMRVGATYLLFIYADHGRQLVDYCGNSGLLPSRTKELKLVEQLAQN